MKKKLKGFTLTELLVVLVIIGILMMLVMPNQGGVIEKARMQEAQKNLRDIYQKQKFYKMQFFRYSDDFNEIDFIVEKTTKDGGTANFSYEILEAEKTSFKARATAAEDYDDDGVLLTLDISENGQFEIVHRD